MMNMKRRILSPVLGLLLGIFVLTMVLPVLADEPAADRDRLRPAAIPAALNHFPTRKLGRGVSNVVFGVLEIPNAWISVNKEYGGAAGITWGTFLGIKRFILRELVGVYEIATFWCRHGTIIEPEFPFMPEQTVQWRVTHPQRRR